MPNPSQTVKQINVLIGYLMQAGLADSEHHAFQRGSRNTAEVTFRGAVNVSIALKSRFYREIYDQLREVGAYNARMLDGALIQMTYDFAKGILTRHRLAFFPSP